MKKLFVLLLLTVIAGCGGTSAPATDSTTSGDGNTNPPTSIIGPATADADEEELHDLINILYERMDAVE